MKLPAFCCSFLTSHSFLSFSLRNRGSGSFPQYPECSLESLWVPGWGSQVYQPVVHWAKHLSWFSSTLLPKSQICLGFCNVSSAWMDKQAQADRLTAFLNDYLVLTTRSILGEWSPCELWEVWLISDPCFLELDLYWHLNLFYCISGK